MLAQVTVVENTQKKSHFLRYRIFNKRALIKACMRSIKRALKRRALKRSELKRSALKKACTQKECAQSSLRSTKRALNQMCALNESAPNNACTQ